jgi:hypothetical protein
MRLLARRSQTPEGREACLVERKSSKSSREEKRRPSGGDEPELIVVADGDG